MPTNRLILPALIACGCMTASCASYTPERAAPPKLELPEAAERPCRLPVLPDDPTQADLEATYAQRGEALANCDGARQLAVDTFKAQQALQEQWRRMSRRFLGIF